MTSRPSTAAPTLTVLAIVLVTLGAYVSAYFWLGAYDEWPDPLGMPGDKFISRTYRSKWQATLFAPAGWFEELIKDDHVDIRDRDSHQRSIDAAIRYLEGD